jgi:hypothetical protein
MVQKEINFLTCQNKAVNYTKQVNLPKKRGSLIYK